jgi:hypothetical protein
VSLRFYGNLTRNIEIKAKGSFVQGNGDGRPNSGDKGLRRRGAKVREARGEQTTPVCGLGWGRDGPRQLASGGTVPAAGASGGGGALVRKRARGSVVQLRCEAEKEMGGLVWAMWGRNSASKRGWRLAELGLGRQAQGPRAGLL